MLGLGEAEGVEEVDLVVVRVDPAPDDPQGVGDPAAVGRGEHAGDDDDAVPVGDLGQPLRPRPVQRFGDLDQVRPKQRMVASGKTTSSAPSAAAAAVCSAT